MALKLSKGPLKRKKEKKERESLLNFISFTADSTAYQRAF